MQLPFKYPLPNRMTSGFRLPARPDHDGWDLVGKLTAAAASERIPVCAVESGVVEQARMVARGADRTWEWGWYVCVHTASGHRWYYCHLAEKPAVKVGDRVSEGDMLGYMGNTGYSQGMHLHLGLRSPQMVWVNPGGRLGVPNAKGVYYNKPSGGSTVIPPENQEDEDMPKMKLCRPMNKALSTDLIMENKNAIAGKYHAGEFEAYLSVRALEYENTRDSISRVKDEIKKDAKEGDLLIFVD